MFKATYNCSDCGHRFEKKTESDPRKAGRKPSCPECKKGKYSAMRSISKHSRDYTEEELDKNRREMIESRKAPSTGYTPFTKAMDATAEIVMKDYGMTNLQDNLRAGDSMAPKLAPELERKVDQVFRPQKPIMGQQTAGSMNSALMRQINSGAFRGTGDVVARQQSAGIKVPTNIIHEHGRGKPS